MEDTKPEFGAITIDNSILKSEGYKFNEGLLKQMAQFASSSIRVVQVDIIHNEAKKHIAEQINSIRSSIRSVLNSASRYLSVNQTNITSARDLLSVSGDDIEVADEQLKRYYKRIGAKILKSDKHVDFTRLMNMYFENKPPFEKTKEKKCEFPDAITLISIEQWAEKNNLRVIAVSSDKGWKNFAENSSWITVIDNLSEAIAIFQPYNQVNKIIAHIREDALFEEENHVLTQIEEAIVNSLEAENILVNASSDYIYEETSTYIEFIDHELEVDKNGLVNINVVRIENDTIVLQVSASVECEVTADFKFFTRDYIDNEDLIVGGLTRTIEEVYDTDILIHLTGNLAEGFKNLEVTEIEVLETIDCVNFGEIGPEYGDYDE